MTVTTNTTRIELSTDERNILRRAIDVLNNVNDVIEDFSDINYIISRVDMDIYNEVYDEIDRIEDYVKVQL